MSAPHRSTAATRRHQAAAVLGVPVTATADEAQAAFRAAARRAHPDAGGSHEAFLALADALEVLRTTPVPVAPRPAAHATPHATAQAAARPGARIIEPVHAGRFVTATPARTIGIHADVAA